MSANIVSFESSGVGSASGTSNVNVAALTPGNAVIVMVEMMNGTNISGTTVSHSGDGNYTQRKVTAPTTLGSIIFDKFNVSGGQTVVTITPDAAMTSYRYAVFEVSGLDSGGTIQTDDVLNSAVSSHICASPGMSGTGFAVSGGVFSVAQISTEGSGWTRYTPPGATSAGGFIQARVGTLSSNQGPYTTGASTNSQCAMAFYPESVAAAGTPFFTTIGAKRI